MNRFREPSTYSGLGILFGLLSTLLPQYSVPLQAVAGAAGSLAVLLREGGK